MLFNYKILFNKISLNFIQLNVDFNYNVELWSMAGAFLSVKSRQVVTRGFYIHLLFTTFHSGLIFGAL